ncbi:MAG: hypothetical protein RRB13_09900 [bacterium]|nr:hypothetical protein [bacterium]
MNKKIKAAAILTLFLWAPSLQAVEFLYKDENGQRHFQCSGLGGGGKARAKQVGKDKYLVFGGAYKGIVVPAISFFEAARKACGEITE